MTSARHATRRAGFTLIELMISMIAGSVVIAGAWYMSETSSRMFNDQLRRAETQMTLRGATAALTRDIARAGLLSVRTDVETPNCGGAAIVSPVSPLNAVTVSPGPNGQMLTLIGNFTTDHQYPADQFSSTPNVLVLDQTTSTFRESFTNPATNAVVPQRVLDAFLPDPTNAASQGRMVSVQHLGTGTIQLRFVTAVQAAGGGAISITINPPLSVGGNSAGCMTNMEGLLVAPISAVRYAIENPGSDPELAQIAGAGATGGQRNALIRREINMTSLGAATTVTLPGTARIVCDYATVFRVAAVQDTNPTPGAVPTLAYLPTPEVPVNANAFRSLIVELAANAQALARVTADTNEQAQRAVASRRGIRFEVFMPNMTRRAGVM